MPHEAEPLHRLLAEIGLRAGGPFGFALAGGHAVAAHGIALLPSLARRDDIATLTQGYGHVIVDECHHLGAAAYEHSVKRIAAQFWLGLTATPNRRDGLGQLVTWQLGPVRHTVTDEEQGTLAASVHADAGPRRVLFLHDTEFKPGDVDLDAPGALAEVHRRLAIDESRNTRIADDVAAAFDAWA